MALTWELGDSLWPCLSSGKLPLLCFPSCEMGLSAIALAAPQNPYED